jgi:hypothetical protein
MKNLIIILSLSVVFISCKKQSNDPATQSSSSNSTPTPTSVPWVKPSAFFDTKQVYSFCSIGTNLFVGTSQGRYKSTDNGNNWSSISSGLTDSSLCYVFTDGTSLYTKIDGISGITAVKIYKSINNGTTWTQVWNPIASSCKALSFVGSKIFISSGSSIYTSSNNGVSWSQSYSGSMLNIPFVISDGTNFFTTDGGAQILKSVDGGTTFNTMTNDTISSISPITPMTVTGTKLFIGAQYSKGVYLSSNSGNNWAPARAGIVGATNPLTISRLYSDGANVFATSTNRIFKSSDNGTSWSKLGDDFPNSSGSNQILCNFLLKTSGYVYAITSKGLFKIAD